MKKKMITGLRACLTIWAFFIIVVPTEQNAQAGPREDLEFAKAVCAMSIPDLVSDARALLDSIYYDYGATAELKEAYSECGSPFPPSPRRGGPVGQAPSEVAGGHGMESPYLQGSDRQGQRFTIP